MAIDLGYTDDDYYFFVTYGEMVSRAKEQGFNNPILLDRELDEECVRQVLLSGKSVAIFTFAKNDDEVPDYIVETYRKLDIEGIKAIVVNAGYKSWGDTEDPENLEECLKTFPTVGEFENYLGFRNIILCKDYLNKCGNCHSQLEVADKYCRYCGTERGKGKFEPYANEFYCVYGPQVKRKYKCTGCGHIWITTQMGDAVSKYCPQCGKKTGNVIQMDVFEDTMFGYVGTKEPFDEEERPILLTEEQVDLLMKQERGDITFGPNRNLAEIMKKCNIIVPDGIDDFSTDISEEDGERLTLVDRILRMEGDNPRAYKRKYCPHCSSQYCAAIGYSIYSKTNEALGSIAFLEPDGASPVIYNKYNSWVLGEDFPNEKQPALICLRCGTEYGMFGLSKKQERKYSLLELKGKMKKMITPNKKN